MSRLYKNILIPITFKTIIFLTFTLLLLNIIMITACGSDEQVVPVYQPVAAPPEEVMVEQLLSDYLTDEVAADAKYDGKRLLFINIEVEKIIAYWPTSADDPIIYIVNNSIEFRPRYFVDTVYVREGFVVDIVGEVRGLFGIEDRYLVMENCWVKIVEGDIGGAYENPDY